MLKKHYKTKPGFLIIFIIIALAIILYFVVDKLTSNQSETLSMLLSQSNKITEQNIKDGSKILKLRNENSALIMERKSEYYNKLTYAIIGYYHGSGTIKEKTTIREIVEKAFISSSELHKRGLIKEYAPDPRLTALRVLGECRFESNFYIWSVCNEKNGTKSYGLCQINDCNLESGYQKLKRVGLWSPDSGKWAFDIEVNFYLRLLVNEDRTRRGWDKKDVGNWDAFFVELLSKISGYEGLKWG